MGQVITKADRLRMKKVLKEIRAEKALYKQLALELLRWLKPEDRRDVMSPFCSYCGRDEPCNCMRDD